MSDDKVAEYMADVANEVRDHDYWIQCDCGGSGSALDAENRVIECPDCDGSGWIEI
jgi:hypothetical protein